MKKIIQAWIDQVIQFDTDSELEQYIKKLNSGKDKGRYQILSTHKLGSGDGEQVIVIRIRKPYNNNDFPIERK